MTEMLNGEQPEIRMNPLSGEIAQRWSAGFGWELVGGTHDGEVLEAAEVESWTPLVAEPSPEDLVTEATFELAGPVVGVALMLVRLKEDLDTLEEMAEALVEAGWSPEMTGRISEDVRDMLRYVRKAADKVETRLPEIEVEDDAVDTEDGAQG